MSVSSTQITIRLFAGWVFLLLGLLQAVPRTQSFHVSSSSSTRNSGHASLILSSPSAKNMGRRINQNDNQCLPLFMVEENDATDSEPPVIPVKCPDCNKCDGSGRIEGGIGTVLKFWPIKCFRPCPNFIENGGLYQRAGQGLNEIAFGRDTKYDADYDDYEY